MTILSAAVGASLLAHGLHITMLLLGLWGLAALLLPHTLDRMVGRDAAPFDAHDARVRELRSAVGGGTLLARAAADPSPVTADAAGAAGAAPARTAGSLALPLSVVASAAAATIHLAVAPHHLDESTLLGSFFLVSAVAQALWALVAIEQPSYALLRVGVVGNVAILLLWACTRTLGLPLGLLPGREAVGGWDVVCAVWEVVLVGTALALLRTSSVPSSPPLSLPSRCPRWFDWHPAARAAVGLAGVSITLLMLMGGHS